MSDRVEPTASPSKSSHAATTAATIVAWIVLVVLAGALTWSYREPLAQLLRWWNRPPYLLGWVVPVLAVLVLIRRRRPLEIASDSARRFGLVLLALGLAARLYFAAVGMEIGQMLTLLPCLMGIVLIAGGTRWLGWFFPAILLLVLMFPLSWTLENMLLDPLQSGAMRASVFLLQTVGFEAYNDGNTLFLSHTSGGIVDPCSRLRLATLIVAVAAALLLLVPRPRWERWVILLSAVPIAMAANVVRITAGAVAFARGNTALSEGMLSVLGACVVLVIGLVLLTTEALVLARLMREDRRQRSPRSPAPAARAAR